MSMMDETPSYSIREGYIYEHTSGTHYRSCGFECGDPAIDIKLHKATDDYIASYLEQGKDIYDYDNHKWIKHVNHVMVDSFGNKIYNGSRVLFLHTDSTGKFREFEIGTVIGDTPEYIKVKPDDIELAYRWGYVWNPEKQRNVYSKIKTDYILRSKTSNRVLLIRGIQ